MHLFSIRWERIQARKNIIQVRITFLDQEGRVHQRDKFYEEWIGVCTNSIDRLVRDIKLNFPGHNVLYEQIGQAKKILPYFKERLARGKLEYRSKPLYKVYTTAPHENVGRFFNRYKIGYFDPSDWLIRIYIDLCTRYDSHSFYYKWYEVEDAPPGLMESLRMLPERRDQPDWTVGAFDLETVPLAGDHIPLGYDRADRIVMISIYKWNRRKGVQKWLLYLLPDGMVDPLECEGDFRQIGFGSESEMLIEFHRILKDAQVLTGYNIDSYDLPCIFARLVWLKLNRILTRYSSSNVGTDLVTTFDKKLVLDLYPYFKTFSGYDLPSFKLDDVARVKLKGETKIPIKSTGIWSWYRYKNLPRDLFEEKKDVERCFRILKPQSRVSEFGTFTDYMDYCLKDSELVYQLFEKEHVLSFMVERANFTALNAVDALHLGNSRYLLELFKTYGARLGYFINSKFFDAKRIQDVPTGGSRKTYQGALNYCYPERVYENVSVMDFASMYPSSLLSSNLCYGTCSIMPREEWLACPAARNLTAIPYREHGDKDFVLARNVGSRFSYPAFDPDRDKFVMVINTEAEAFLPQIVAHFIRMRQHHQKQWKTTRDVYHYNVQLGIKILINSLYGVMANKESPLAYLDIAMMIVTLSRYQLLGSYHYLKNKGYDVCYCDTDSLMVHKWPHSDCDEVNAFLNLPSVELKYEQRMKRLLVLSKKRYVYQRDDTNQLVTKGFQKKINGLVEKMTDTVLSNTWSALFEEEGEKEELSLDSRGWIIWVDMLSDANYRCRDPKSFSIYRKVKNIDEYKSASCASVKYLEKYPDKKDEHVEFTYGRVDVSATEASNWIVDVQDCQYVDFEKLFTSQKKIFCMLLNMAYWQLPAVPTFHADMVLNAMHWKRLVHAELLHWHATGNKLLLLVEPGVRYTFEINDHLKKERRPGRRKANPEDIDAKKIKAN